MTRCADCDAVLSERDKNTAGHYRDRCLDCITSAAPDVRHIDQCDRADCRVCRSWRAEH